ncbi:hypothetical protein FQR65_LT02289 [Abscondita terminalis]|nr:hypothetical protein FQR65_LT02289 [Abscondita terminalis]
MSQDKVLITNEVQLFFEEFLKKLQIYNFAINVEPGSNFGDNFSGTIAKAKVHGDDRQGNKISQSFIIKSAAQNEMYRKLLLLDFRYSREIYMYKTVLYEYNLLQTELNIKIPFKSYPKYYDSSLETLNEALVLEDMKQREFELYNGQQLLNFEHAVMILREYAKLHALSFAMRLHKPNVFKRLTEHMEEGFFEIFEKNHKNNGYWKQGKKILLTIDEVKEKSIYEKFEKFVTNMSDLIQNLQKTNLMDAHGVITHGDCWLKNYMFKYNNFLGSRTPVDVCILDWQLSHYGSPALDLAYFIFSCTEKELRDKYYAILIEEYYSMFSKTLTKMGGNPQQQFSFQTLQEHLKKYSVFGLYAALMSLLAINNENSEMSDVGDISEAGDLVDRIKKNTEDEYLYNKRMKDVILDIERLGYDFY